MKCPFCNAVGCLKLRQPDLLLKILPDVLHDVFYCVHCDIYYCTSIAPDSLSLFYPVNYYISSPIHGPIAILSKIRVRFRARAVEWRAIRGAVLDVGCGRGTLLNELKRRGWTAVGTDWNLENAKQVNERFDIKVLGGESALDCLCPDSFHAISILHVLEHDQDPKDMLKKVHRLVIPGGRLLVGVPNGKSLIRSIFGRFWMGYDVPRHRFVFTPKSLKVIMEEAGFTIDRISGRFSDEVLDAYRSSRLFFDHYGITNKLPSVLFMLLLSLPILFLSFIGLGSVIYAYAKKN